jgi:hypothetical protein
MGMCLLGTAAGVPRDEVLSVRCGGGVVDRPGKGGARATMVAMIEDKAMRQLNSAEEDPDGAQMKGKGRRRRLVADNPGVWRALGEETSGG